MARKKIAGDLPEAPETAQEQQAPAPSDEKARLEARLVALEMLYKQLQEEGIRSISDLEVKIANVRLEISKFA